MLVSATEMLKKARDGHYAVGQFNINNLEWTKAVLLTAQELNSPVILGVSEGAGKYMTGYIHGKYPANWKGLDFDALDKIHEATNGIPLVLHGGTGIPADMIQKAISLGVSKINVNTECQLSFAAATREYIEAGKDQQGKGYDPRKLLLPGFEAIKATVKEKMELFGSVNKA